MYFIAEQWATPYPVFLCILSYISYILLIKISVRGTYNVSHVIFLYKPLGDSSNHVYMIENFSKIIFLAKVIGVKNSSRARDFIKLLNIYASCIKQWKTPNLQSIH